MSKSQQSGDPLSSGGIRRLLAESIVNLGWKHQKSSNYIQFICVNQRNLRLEVFDNCREFSTNRPFYAKQTQFPKKSNDVTFFYTMDYENISDWTLGENKPNSNPIKPCPERSRMGQSPKSQNERKLICYRGLQKKRWFYNPNKQTQFR